MSNFYLAQGGSTLYQITNAGTATALTLPTGVTIDSAKRPRFAVLNDAIAIVNSPSKALWVSLDGTVRLLALEPPASPPALTTGAAGALNGAYKVRVSFAVFDDDHKLLAESGMSPVSEASVAMTNDALQINGIPISDNSSINGRRVYRTVSSGSGEVVFHSFDIYDNVQTRAEDNMTDANLQLTAASNSIGRPPSELDMIVSWNGRLWARSSKEPDVLYFTDDGLFYSWPVRNQIPIPVKGFDDAGITLLAARREELVVGKRDSIHRITGVDEDTFKRITVDENSGCIAPDSAVVYHNVLRFLGEGHVFQYDNGGVKSISREKVHGWFNSDTYFTRSRFNQAFAKMNPYLESYDLHLAAVGSSVEDRWVQFMHSRGIWFGPHKTGLFTPTCGALMEDTNDLDMPVIGGSDGQIYKMNQSTYRDGAATAVDYDVDSIFHSAKTPDIEKLWQHLLMITKVQAAGTLTITPKVGGLDAVASSALSHTLTLGRQDCGVLSEAGKVGRFLQLNFRQNTVNQGCEIMGYEAVVHEAGRR